MISLPQTPAQEFPFTNRELFAALRTMLLAAGELPVTETLVANMPPIMVTLASSTTSGVEIDWFYRVAKQ